ncbi:MAG: putative glycoside hydrolase [Candidatus Marinimicrobia bacterium]|nr:putative glycoside hydrolase [Candidatus Neomarinimicrobiota bacterium]
MLIRKAKYFLNKKPRTTFFVLFGCVCVSGSLLFFSLKKSYTIPMSYEKGAVITSQTKEDGKEDTGNVSLPVEHLETPNAVKTIYMTQCVVGTPSFRQDLVDLVNETELNSIIIDVKDFSGGIGFKTDNPKLKNFVSDNCRAPDIKEFVEYLHSQNIYAIARITVFQDPLYTSTYPKDAVKKASDGTVWKDYKKISFVDVGATDFWDYIIELSKEAYGVGFDELNFDYVRFPSDGPMKDIYFPYSNGREKADALEEFFVYLSKTLKDPKTYHSQRVLEEFKKQGFAIEGSNLSNNLVPKISADLFGMTTTNTDDLWIGQVLERTLPYFDYVAPMVYPSHYPYGFNGWGNPNNYPYEIIEFCMAQAVKRAVSNTTTVDGFATEPIYETKEVFSNGATTTEQVFSGLYSKEVYSKLKLRPWLQDFDYGGDYDVDEVRAQIQATYDAGLNSWMLWAPSNRYTRGALNSSD